MTFIRVLRGAVLLALLLSAIAAAASLAGLDAVSRLVGSRWFVALAAGVGLLSLAAAVLAPATRQSGWPLTALLHLGVAAGLAGVAANQLTGRAGYVFLESGGGATNFYLDRRLGRVEPLPFSVRLDSVGQQATQGFRPAPVAWVSTDTRAALVRYNRPLRCNGWRLVFGTVVGPGFPHEYEITVSGQDYLLLHNQLVKLADGVTLSSVAFDPDARALDLLVAGQEVWLASGDTARVGGHELVLKSVAFAGNRGVVFTVYDARFRPLLFGGFGLVLAAAFVALVRRNR